MLMLMMMICGMYTASPSLPASAAGENGFVVPQWRDDIMSAIPASRGSLRLRIRAGRTRTRSVQRREYRVSTSAISISSNAFPYVGFIAYLTAITCIINIFINETSFAFSSILNSLFKQSQLWKSDLFYQIEDLW